MDFEPEDAKWGHRVSQVGFNLVALSIGLLCLAETTSLSVLLGFGDRAREWQAHPAWLWLVDAPITWLSLLGSLVLRGRGHDPTWQRRLRLLIFLNAIDAGTWTLTRGEEFGMSWGQWHASYTWCFVLLSWVTGWIELMLMAGLAADVISEGGLKADQAAGGSDRLVRVLGTIGLIVWGLVLTSQTDWNLWPPRARFTADYPLFLLITMGLMCVSTFHVTALGLLASRMSRERIAQLEAQEYDSDSLKSRSETENDDIRWL